MPDPIEIITVGSAKFTADFRSCVWQGKAFEFTNQQSVAVRVLAEAHLQGWPALHRETILNLMGREGCLPSRFDHVFRSRGKTAPAWGTLIVSKGRALFGLAVDE